MGLDPGLTVGIAILNLEGDLLYLKSMKEASRSDILKKIMERGRVIVIGTDVYPPPKMVKKIATALNSRLHAPPSILSVASKNELVNTFLKEKGLEFSLDAHQRDALVAAIKTYRHYENKLRQVEARVTDKGITKGEINEIKGLVIKGTPITNAIRKVKTPEVIEEAATPPVSEKPENGELPKLKKRIKIQERRIKQQINLIKRLERQNRTLKEKLRKQRRENIKLKKKIQRLHHEYSKDLLLNKELSSKISLIKKLQEKYSREKSLRENLEKNLDSLLKMKDFESSGDKTPIKVVQSFTKEGIKEACNQWKIKKGDAILLYSAKGGGSQTAKILVKIGPKAIITTENMSHQAAEIFEDAGIPIIPHTNIDMEMRENFALVKTKNLEKEIRKWKNKIIEKRKKREKQKLWRVIDEYRAKRRRI